MMRAGTGLPPAPMVTVISCPSGWQAGRLAEPQGRATIRKGRPPRIVRFPGPPAPPAHKIHATFGDPAGDRRAQFLPSERSSGLVRQCRYLLFAQTEREQLLPCGIELDTRVLCAGAGAQVIVLGHDLALPERCRTCEKRLLKLVGHPRREIFTLGVGHFAAFDNRYDLVLLDRIAKPLAQLDDGSEQPDRDAGNAVRRSGVTKPGTERRRLRTPA